MTPQQLSRLSTLLDEAMDLDPDAQAAWLERLGPADGEMRSRLQVVLRHLADGGFRSPIDANLADVLRLRYDDEVRGPEAGDRLGPYRLLRKLGTGGMGEVWLAERADGALRRQVALKLPISALPRDLLLQRFERERDILASLEHPHIARLYDAGVDGRGQPYMALEYVEGVPIDRWCREHASSVRTRLTLLLDVADAVAFAHSRLVIHRDLKPANILVTAAGQVRLLDFGIAKLLEGGADAESTLTRAGGQPLTLSYASPEQIRGEAIGTASDVYSLGVLGYELVAGARPYQLSRGGTVGLEQAILDVDPPAPSRVALDRPTARSLRGDLDAVLLRALRKVPSERYATVDAFAQDLRRHLGGQAVMARPDSLALRIGRMARRHRIPLAVGTAAVAAFALAIGAGATALLAATLALGLLIALAQARRARHLARTAEQEARTASAVQRFLLDVFESNSAAQVDPERARATTARDLLDRGARELDRALADAPEVRQQLMSTLARMYRGLSLHAVAADLERRRIGLLGERRAPASELASAWIELSHDEVVLGRLEAASEEIDTALSILEADGDRDSELRGHALSVRATLAIQRDDADALRWAHSAVEVLRKHPPSTQRADSLHLYSHELSRQGRFDEALAIVDEGLRDAAALGGRGAGVGIALERARARLLGSLGRVIEGELRQREILAQLMQRLGVGSLETLIAMAELGSGLFERGEFVAAEEVMRQGAEQMRLRMERGETDWVSRPLAAYHAAALAHLGDLAAGSDMLRRLVPGADDPAVTSLRADLQYRTMRLRAGLCLLRGEYAEAAVLAAASRQIFERHRPSGNEEHERQATLQAAVAAGLRDLQALSDLARREAALPATPARWPLRAELALALDDIDTAQACVVGGLKDVERLRPHVHRADLERRLLMVEAGIRRRKGALADAEAAARAALALASGRLDMRRSVTVAMDELVLVELLIEQGQRDEAIDRVAHVVDVFEGQQPIAPASMAALRDLQRRVNMGKHEAHLGEH